MSGLIALLDDVAAIAKVAAASVDDVIAQAAKAGTKAAGAVIDDAAVTPKYVTGFSPARELPIVWRIARGSIFNKLVFLLPAGLLLNTFAPWVITPLLMLGGAYLCFEGAEKIWHVLAHKHAEVPKTVAEAVDAAHLEEQRVSGAIKTDFILSAEIMTIALAAIPDGTIWMEAATLAVVAVGITVMVYGSVALIVKADDFGLHLSQESSLAMFRALGRGIVKSMPTFLKVLTTVGTAAMLWVGGSIVIHGLKDLGQKGVYTTIHHLADQATQMALSWGVTAEGFVTWFATAAMDGVFGLALGLLLIPIVAKVIEPLWHMLRGKKDAPDGQ
ncbi:DUF808 domain-containing protein [Roseibium sediminis]|uniref:DUF808 domain-containing protein n=1 Tax=Roseibium sediminis TaxID=1775174 RepID=UPI00123D8685|nr:DUF808 domain-containing protein [Roseibium sediminis]